VQSRAGQRGICLFRLLDRQQPTGQTVPAQPLFRLYTQRTLEQLRTQLDPGKRPHLPSTPEIFVSNHACPVAETAYDPDPIPANAAPGNTDKLGQRNLDWSPSDNPGAIDSHRIPATFDIRPTATGTTLPDELMIEWGNT